MTIVEKNDVDINKLFTWGRVFEVAGDSGEAEALVYMRLLGDADVNRARVYALRESANLRKRMNDPESDEHMIYVKEIDEFEKEDIINYIVMFSMRAITNLAIKEVKIPNPKQPKADAGLEEMEEFQKSIDEFPDKLHKATEEYMVKEVSKLRKSLEPKDKEELYKEYKRALIDEFCEQKAYQAYKDMEIYLGCYKDDSYKEKFFESLEQYLNLDINIKASFRTAYDKLEMSMNDLKKLRQATQ